MERQERRLPMPTIKGLDVRWPWQRDERKSGVSDEPQAGVCLELVEGDDAGVNELCERDCMVRVGGGRRDRRPFETRAALGISGGCYVGAGFGFAVGIGNLWMLPGKSDTAIVTPSLQLQPFAHQGYLVGAFCGVAIGSGFGASVAKGIGFAFELEALLALFRALVRGKFVSALNASARRPKRQVTSKLLISSSSSNHIRSRPAGFIASASVPRING